MMTACTIQAVSFDLWDTIVHDDSDEAKRKAQGLLSKREQRRHLLWQALCKEGSISLEQVSMAYDVADAAFNTVWHDQHVTWPIAARIDVILKGLDRTLAENDLAEVIHAHEMMEVDIYPDIIDGCAQALEQLASRYRLAIVSDTIVSPGTALRQLLEKHGVAQYFSAFAFSDEVGRSKPHRSMFESAASQLGVDVREMVHLGDRDHNDVKGPQAIGMKAILFTASRDVDQQNTSADAICAHYSKLPEILESLEN
jgi:putative hydrolase of the HAD superfamily